MNYQETVQYLFNVTPVFEKIGAGAYKAGLENTLALDEHFGHPHRQFKTIHVAGTNGKGSCSHTLAAILQSSGLKVGLYTSPHLVDFRERIRVNGQTVSEEYVVNFVEQERSFFEPLHPSFFELTTAMAFKYFAEQQVDVAVIEVGLGGRLDCTNIIMPVLSIITNISFDHTQFLGNTLQSIAAEKAGIMKRGVPVIIGEATSETRPVFEEKAKAAGSPILFAEDAPEVISAHTTEDGGMLYETRNFGQLKGELGGLYQAKNTNTILKAVSLLPMLGRNDVADGFAKVSELTGLVGRWQKMREHPTVVCDTGHNVGGWIYLSEQLKRQKCRVLRIVFGMVDDKDIDSVMDMLPKDAVYYFTKGTTKRAISENIVADKAKSHGLDGSKHADVKSAYEAALSDANAEDFIFVGGSSYIVSDFLFTCF